MTAPVAAASCDAPPCTDAPVAPFQGATVSDEWIRLERTIARVGKVKKGSKRCVTWVLQHQPTFTVYRISLTWSIKSGKYSISCNDQEQVFDRLHRRASLIDHSFSLLLRSPPGQGTSGDTTTTTTTRFRIVTAKSVPTRTPFVQYDLLVNGVKFCHLAGDLVLADDGLPSLADVVLVSASK